MKNLEIDLEKMPSQAKKLVNMFLNEGEKKPLEMMLSDYQENFLACPHREDAIKVIKEALDVIDRKN